MSIAATPATLAPGRAPARDRAEVPETSVAWTQRGLPGPVVAQAGVPVSESVVSVTALVLAFVPLWLWTERAVWGFALAAGAAAGLSYVLWARRVAVGEDFLAVRQLGRYHAATGNAFRHLTLAPTQHGGTLRVTTDDGRVMRLRRAEYTRPDVNAALRDLCAASDTTCDDTVLELLDLPFEARRVRHRYLADAVR